MNLQRGFIPIVKKLSYMQEISVLVGIVGGMRQKVTYRFQIIKKMNLDNKINRFQECYKLWLSKKHTKHTDHNFRAFCQVWNMHITRGQDDAIEKFRKELNL